MDTSAEANTVVQPNTNSTVKLYTPNMVAVSTLIGGPLAGSILIAANYKACAKNKNALNALLSGFGLIIIVAILAFILKLNLPATAGAFTYGFRSFSKSVFGVNNPKSSWWITILISIVGLIINFVSNIVVALFLHLCFGISFKAMVNH